MSDYTTHNTTFSSNLSARVQNVMNTTPPGQPAPQGHFPDFALDNASYTLYNSSNLSVAEPPTHSQTSFMSNLSVEDYDPYDESGSYPNIDPSYQTGPHTTDHPMHTEYTYTSAPDLSHNQQNDAMQMLDNIETQLQQMQNLEPVPLTKDAFKARFPVYRDMLKFLVSTTLWLALEDDLFDWELVLKGSNGDLSQSPLCHVAANAIHFLGQAHQHDCSDVLEADAAYYTSDIITWCVDDIMKILDAIRREGRNEAKELGVHRLNSPELNQANYKYWSQYSRYLHYFLDTVTFKRAYLNPAILCLLERQGYKNRKSLADRLRNLRRKYPSLESICGRQFSINQSFPSNWYIINAVAVRHGLAEGKGAVYAAKKWRFTDGARFGLLQRFFRNSSQNQSLIQAACNQCAVAFAIDLQDSSEESDGQNESDNQM